MRALVLLLAVLATAPAAESWDPAAHPATLPRRVTGYTAPIRTLDLAPEMAGRLVAVGPQPGARTSEGPAARLDAALADLAVDQAVAASAAAAAAIAQLDVDRERAERELAQARREEERVAALAEAGRATTQEREARALDRARADLALRTSDARLAAARAEQAAAAAREQDARERRARLDLVAPVGWVVVERVREPGAYVQPGDPVLRLADTATLVVALRLDEEEVAAARAAAEAGTLALRFPARPVHPPAPAAIRRVDVQHDQASRKRLVELTVPGEAAPEASGGLAVELVLEVRDSAGGVLVPNELVKWRLEQPVVRTAEGRELSPVVLRRTGAGLIVPVDGFPAGTRLVPHPTEAAAPAAQEGG